MESAHGSILKGMFKTKREKGKLFTLKGGLEQLIDALASKVKIETNSTRYDGADLVFSTIPEEHFEYSTLHVVQLGYEEDLLKHSGFGYLVPSIYREKVMGAVFDSKVFPEQNRRKNETRLSVMVKACDHPKKEALIAVRRHLGISKLPHEAHVKTFPKAIPKLGLDHQERLRALKTKHPEIIYAGTYVDGPSVNACIKRSKQIASSVSLKQCSNGREYASMRN